jgi:enediyne biosynthesis protein E4
MRLNSLSLALVLSAAGGIARSAAAESTVAIPSFSEETKSAGINSVYSGEWEYMVGGGVATFDCNGDGFADMLLAGGSSRAKFYRNTSRRGGVLHFKRQGSGLELDKVTGVYPLDIDSDGITDLVLLRVGENVVMRGLGHCRFEKANKRWGFDGGDAWSTAFAATWEKGASWPTLAVGNYINRHEDTSPWGSCTDNWLHRPNVVDGKMQNKFAAPLPLKPSFCALSMLFTDWNKSGTPSLRISDDREYYEGGQEQLWHVDANQAPTLYTDKDGWKPLRIWGMGIASYDLNFDGYPEYFLTSMADSKLQTLATVPPEGQPKPGFNDVAWPKGVTAQRPFMGSDLRPSTGWHAQFEDVNNDGLVDLFVAKGNVDKMPDFAAKDPNNLLLQGADGKFQEAADKAGVASMATSRGAALADFNMDGLLDLVVVNHREKAQLWRNTSTNAGHWIEVKLEQPAPNRDAIGSWIEVKRGDKVMRREITSGGGHASGQNGWWHFGLGDAGKAEMRVVWPDGTNGEWQSVDSNNFYVLERGKAARLWVVK